MADSKMEEIGRVGGFFAHPSVAIVELTAPLKIGETIYLKGHTTDFQQLVESMQVDRQPVTEAQAGQSVGIKVQDRCRKHDIVYKLII
jgi:putative protease